MTIIALTALADALALLTIYVVLDRKRVSALILRAAARFFASHPDHEVIVWRKTR